MREQRPAVAAVWAAVAGLLLLVGCSTDAGSSVGAEEPHRSEASSAESAPGASGLSGVGSSGASEDADGGTVAPGATLPAERAGDSSGGEGWRIRVVAAGDAESTAVLDAVRAFADDHGGTVVVSEEEDPERALEEGIADADADVIVGIGPGVAGPFDLLSAANLDRSFLMLGTQLAEPTENVTAVVWPGADERMVFADEQPEFTGADEFAAAAVERGVAAVSNGREGYVYDLGASDSGG